MSNNCDDIASILLTDGTNQSQRNETALDPDSLKIHGFGMEEWMKFAWRFADHLNFYNANNSDTTILFEFCKEYFPRELIPLREQCCLLAYRQRLEPRKNLCGNIVCQDTNESRDKGWTAF